MEDQEQDKTAGKVEPIKLTPEQIEKRKHEEATRDNGQGDQNGGKGGQASKQGSEAKPKR